MLQHCSGKVFRMRNVWHLYHTLVSLIEGSVNRRECSCRPVFNKKRVLTEGGMHAGSSSIEEECQKEVVHAGKLCY